VSVPFRPVSIPFRLCSITSRIGSVPFRFHFTFPYSVPFCVLFRFLSVFAFVSDTVSYLFFRGHLVLFSGWIPPLYFFAFFSVLSFGSVSIPFQCNFRAFRFRLRFGSILLRFQIPSISCPFLFCFFLVRLRSVPSRIRSVSFPFLFRFLSYLFSFRFPISVRVRLICFFGGTPFRFRSVSGSCLIFPPFVSFLFVSFRHSSVFYSFLIRFRSFRFRHSSSIHFWFRILSIFSVIFCSVPFLFRFCRFRSVPYPFSYVPFPFRSHFPFISLVPFCVPFRFRWTYVCFSYRNPFLLFLFSSSI